jgi:hypothetical protein
MLALTSRRRNSNFRLEAVFVNRANGSIGVRFRSKATQQFIGRESAGSDFVSFASLRGVLPRGISIIRLLR